MAFFNQLKEGLSKTKDNFTTKLNQVLGIFTRVDDELMDELEEILVLCDMGVKTTRNVMNRLKNEVKQKHITSAAQVKEELKRILKDMVTFDADDEVFPKVILVVGVNGVGKTTSIGKIANDYKEKGKTVLLAAADTFRAAAANQLTIWANRANVPIIKYEGEGHDPAAVVYDALCSAKQKKVDVLICDTAGRLHNKKNLMAELDKINRVIDREYPSASRETYLVLDATTGQNALVQAKEFSAVTDLTGIVLTKLDGTAKGGMVFAIKEELNLPVRYIGIGEGIDDLKPFDAREFVDALID